MTDPQDSTLRVKCLASGTVRHGKVCKSPWELRGPYVAVVENLNELRFEDARNARAIICGTGCRTSHVTILCKILAIPVVQLARCLELLPDGVDVCVDANREMLWIGSLPSDLSPHEAVRSDVLQNRKDIRIQLSIIDSSNIKSVNARTDYRVRQFFLREEFIWARHGRRPFQTLAENGVAETAQFLAANLQDCGEALKSDQKLNFRSLDLRSDEFRALQPEIPVESNPHLGLHGVRRLLHHRGLLEAELVALASLTPILRSQVVYSIPFVTYADEVKHVLQLASEFGIHVSSLGVFLEVPSAVAELPQILELGVTNVYVGTKDLTQFLLACDRGNGSVAGMYTFRAPVVIRTIREICLESEKAGVQPFIFCPIEDVDCLVHEIPQITSLSLTCGEYLT